MATQTPLITIDVGGSRKGFHALALTDGACTAQLHSRDVQELVHWWRERIGASVIAIDAPCRWSTTGRMRPCERELMGQGIFCFATPSLVQAEQHPSNDYGWMLRGAALVQAIDRIERPSAPSPPTTWPAAAPARFMASRLQG